MPKSNKTLAREWALQCLYQAEIRGQSADQATQVFWNNFHSDQKPSSYFQYLLHGVKAHLEELDAYISRFSEHWRLERMALVDRNILRLAAFELLYSSQVPPKVAINEAIELAKNFGTEDSKAFINGILDRIWNATKAGAMDQGSGVRI